MDFARCKSLVLIIALIMAIAPPLGAHFLFNPRPAPEARWFAITEFGAVIILNRVEASSREQLLNWELGLMGNLNPRHSLGGTLFISYSKDAEIYAVPKLRYRYWLHPNLNLKDSYGTI